MKKVMIGALAGLGIIAVPFTTLAATYEYVNTSGNLETVVANSAEQALTIPTDIAPHSGVILAPITPVTTPVIVTPVITNPVTTNPVTNPATTTVSTVSYGTYSEQVPANNAANYTYALMLNQNGTATLTQNFNNGMSPVVEAGTWLSTGPNQVQVSLSGNGSTVYSQPHVITFTQNGTTLTPSAWSSSYSSQYLTFKQS